MRVDYRLLDRLRLAYQRERAISNGLRAQLIEIEQHRRHAAGALVLAEQRATGMGLEGRVRPGEDEPAFNQRMNDIANAKTEQRRRLREAFRGHDPALLAEQLRSLDVPGPEHFEAAVREAQAVLARVDAEIADLTALQGQAASMTGRFRATIEAAENFLAAHHAEIENEVEAIEELEEVV
jgi:hypothetical protein